MRLQKIPNNAPRVIFRSSKHEHVSQLLHPLYWISICQLINFSTMCFSSATGSGSQYLADILKSYVPSRQLRSSSDTRLLQIPFVKTVIWPTRSCLSKSYSLEQTLVEHQACSFCDLFQSCYKN